MSDGILWAVFAAAFVILMAADLGFLSRKRDAGRSPLFNVALCVLAALAFGIMVLYAKGGDAAASYYAAYIIELAMSVDNLFVFIVIFAAFSVPSDMQHRVLFWGILGAIAFRAVFIVAGAGLLESFDFVMVIFGIILILTAVKTAMPEKEGDGTDSLVFRLSRRIPATAELSGGRFLARADGRLLATPLLLCLVVIELSDVIFAFDSIPAALSITTDILVVFTSNIFAVLGLRSMFSVVRGAVGRLVYLKYGLAAILVFIGSKMLLGASGVCDIGVPASLAVIVAILAVTVAVSLVSGRSS